MGGVLILLVKIRFDVLSENSLQLLKVNFKLFKAGKTRFIFVIDQC